MEFSLQADHLTKLYNGQSPAVNDITLRVRPGEFLTLLGPSGGGKTTTLRLLAGFETPTKGRIQIGDHIVADDTHFTPPEKRKVGMVFQDYALFPMSMSPAISHLACADRERNRPGKSSVCSPSSA